MASNSDEYLTGEEIERIEKDPVLSVEDVLAHREANEP